MNPWICSAQSEPVPTMHNRSIISASNDMLYAVPSMRLATEIASCFVSPSAANA
jgi:hypothetical protein